jgi:hypothetical protein
MCMCVCMHVFKCTYVCKGTGGDWGLHMHTTENTYARARACVCVCACACACLWACMHVVGHVGSVSACPRRGCCQIARGLMLRHSRHIESPHPTRAWPTGFRRRRTCCRVPPAPDPAEPLLPYGREERLPCRGLGARRCCCGRCGLDRPIQR